MFLQFCNIILQSLTLTQVKILRWVEIFHRDLYEIFQLQKSLVTKKEFNSIRRKTKLANFRGSTRISDSLIWWSDQEICRIEQEATGSTCLQRQISKPDPAFFMPIKAIQFFFTRWVRRFEPTTAGWEARMLPLCCAVPSQ